MTKRQKLELTWIGMDVRPKLEPRILLGDPEKSYHAKHHVTNAHQHQHQHQGQALPFASNPKQKASNIELWSCRDFTAC